MKTHVIHLAAHDDYHSTRDQMTWGKSARILLVLPRKERILRSRLDLVLLERQAVALGAQLALVTDDELVLGNAEDLKIPVFETIKEAQQKSWKVSGKKKSSGINYKSHPPGKGNTTPSRPVKRVDLGNTWTRVFVFFLGVFAVIVLLLVLLPEAEIEITPASQRQEMSFTIRADPRVEQANIAGLVPINKVTIPVTESRTIKTSGIITIGETSAIGELVIKNLTDSALTVPAGSVFRTLIDPVQRFQSTQPVKLPARIGGTSRVPIQAINPGEAGNVEKETIQGVEGQIGLLITVTNPLPSEGGADRQVSAPTEQDLHDLEKAIQFAFETSALNAIKENAGEDSIIIPQSIKIGEVLNRFQEPEIGTPSDTISLTMTAESSGSLINAEDIQQAAKLILDANLPDADKPSEDGIEVDIISKEAEDGEWLIKASRLVSKVIHPDEIAQLAAGKTPQVFLTALSDIMPMDGNPKIQIRPFFLGRFPLLPMRIHVKE